ncbi:hypothetical protein BCR43DRAFT_453189 [Syncephalastrum racemosum]|uniref:Uncharacterized protein n=1 Tax=Syncephalastrum racemosum TaxID=13706 RepID=A0A1X2HNT4_SYNRA|nr:hypothetical protein BCR43DRAFT_453189 [Syncephalastrum racemosum]
MVAVSDVIVDPLPDVSIYELLFEREDVGENVHTPLLIDAEDTSRFYTLASFRDRMLKVGGLFQQKYGLQRGDVLIVCAQNTIDYPVALHAAVTIGAIGSAVDHNFPAEDISKNLSLVKAKLVITDDVLRSKAEAAASMAGVANPVITFNEIDTMLRQLDVQPAQPVRYTPEELAKTTAYLYFTSGTTGTKKAVMISQRNIVASLTFGKWLPSGLRAMAYTEFHHGSQLCVAMHLSLYAFLPHYIVHLGETVDVRKICSVIQRYKIQTTVCQPWIANTLAKEPWVDDYDLSSVKVLTCGGAMTDLSIIQALDKRLGIKLMNCYGMTEALGMISPSWEASIAGSLGRLGARCIGKIIDNDGNEVPQGEIGELCIKAPTVCLGYYNNPEATKATIDDEGFVHSGDLFRVDENGLYYFKGRNKEMIKYHLHHLYPRDIEEVLIKHPKISDCAVMGVYSKEEATELVTAFISLKEEYGKPGDFEHIKKEVREYVDNQVVDARRLRGGVYIVDSFPRTSFGKIQKRYLVERYIDSSN